MTPARAAIPSRKAAMTIRLHRGDLPDLSAYKGAVAIDTETMGLDPARDRLCVVQLSPGDGSADVVQIGAGQTRAPNLERLLADPGIVKLFHFARFDLAALAKAFNVMPQPVYCTKIASRLARTYTDKHGLKDLAREVLGVDLSKQQQSSDWGADTLTDAQVAYAASDVLHLHALRERLDAMLAREGRAELAAACFRFLPERARLDLAGWADQDIFSHSV
jgi:ribonuclease D